MKCPKCSYNSFELYDSCRKCGSDLVGFKQTHGIRPIVHPPQFFGDESLPTDAFAPEGADTVEETATTDDQIAWNIPAESAGTASDGFAGFDLDFSMDDSKNDDGGSFSFDEDTTPEKEEETGFGDFSFDDDSESNELDDLLNGVDEEIETTPATAELEGFEMESTEFSLETNSLGFSLDDTDLPGEFDMEGMLTDEPDQADERPASGPSIDINDLTDDWPSFFEEGTEEGSKK